jgi:putative BNR repeat neuraminidase
VTPVPTLRRWGASVLNTNARIVAVIGFVEALVITLAASRVSYRYDESVTIGAFIGRGWLVPFTRQRLHNNQPVFSFLENIVWFAGGSSELVFRLLPAVFLGLAVALLTGWTTRRWGVLAGVAAMIVMITHPMVVDLSRQVRGYSLVLLAAVAATLLVDRLLRQPDDVWASVGYTLFIAIGIATHLYAGAVVLGHVGLVIAFRRLSWWWIVRWAVGGGLGLLAYVSIPPTDVRRGFQSSFPADATWDLLGATWLSVVVLGACTVAFLATHRRVWLMVTLPLLATAYIWRGAELATIHPRYFLWVVPGFAVAAAWATSRARWVAVPTLVAGTAMAVIAWPIADSGIRDAAAVAIAADARNYRVCTVGLEAMWAYGGIRGGEFGGTDQQCDVLITIGTWRPGGYDETRAALPFHAEFGDVLVASVVDVNALVDSAGTGESVAAAPPSAEPLLLNDNGGWSWFEDERAVIDTGRCRLLVSSAVDAAGGADAGREGDVEVVAYDASSSVPTRSAVHDGQFGDDHNSAALYVRNDGRYVAMYSLHDTDSFTRWRVSRLPGDVTEWEPEQVLDNGAPTSYSNIYSVPDEGRLYAFIRSQGRDPHFLVSDDDGLSWIPGGQLLTGPDRPYVRYVGDEAGRIHLIATEGVPRESTGIFHGVIDGGQLLRSDGVVVDDDLFDQEASTVDRLTRVFDAVQEGVRVWVIDIELDPTGNPHIVFSTRVPSLAPEENLRTYYYGRFDGSTWHVSPMAHAGHALSPAHPDYSGLVALDPERPSHAVISTDVDPNTGEPLISVRDQRQHFELFEGETRDGGQTWEWSPLTADSTADNIRPIMPKGANDTTVLWLRGTYRNYDDYDLEVVGTPIDGCTPAETVQ